MPPIKDKAAFNLMPFIHAAGLVLVAVLAYYVTTESKGAVAQGVAVHDTDQASHHEETEKHAAVAKLHDEDEFAHPQMVEKLMAEFRASQKDQADRIIAALKPE